MRAKSSWVAVVAVIMSCLVFFGLAAGDVILFLQNAQLRKDASAAQGQADALQQQNTSLKSQAPAAVTDLNDTARIVKTVQMLAVVPTDEQPQLVQVSDKASVKDIAFFDLAVPGDVVLAYQKAKLAVLYRDSEHKVVEVGPLMFTVSSKK